MDKVQNQNLEGGTFLSMNLEIAKQFLVSQKFPLKFQRLKNRPKIKMISKKLSMSMTGGF